MDIFNDAFFFMWVTNSIQGVAVFFLSLGFFGFILSVSAVISFSVYDERKLAKRVAKYSIASLALVLIGLAVPPSSAFYAGAAQYVGETAELDDTLINLKKLVDKKIEELGEED